MRFDRHVLSRLTFRATLVLGFSLALGGCVAAFDPVAARMTGQAEARPAANLGPSCTVEQHVVVTEAFNEARVHLDRAIHFVRDNPRAPHVQRWFGDAPAGVTLATLEATATRMSRPEGVRLECNDPRVCSDGKIAYVRLRSGRLGVCPRFFEASSTGIDARFGILIHEMTHIAAGTRDHAYQPNNATMVAKSHPLLAARNADNYQYFVETLPISYTVGNYGYASSRW